MRKNDRTARAPSGLNVRNVSATTGPAAGYVDDGECTACHGEIARSYQSVAMSRALYPWYRDAGVEDLANNHFHHLASDRHYEMTDRDGTLHVERYEPR